MVGCATVYQWNKLCKHGLLSKLGTGTNLISAPVNKGTVYQVVCVGTYQTNIMQSPLPSQHKYVCVQRKQRLLMY